MHHGIWVTVPSHDVRLLVCKHVPSYWDGGRLTLTLTLTPSTSYWDGGRTPILHAGTLILHAGTLMSFSPGWAAGGL